MPSRRQAREIVKGCRREKSRPATTDVPMISTSRRTVEITQRYVDGEKIRYRDGWAAVGLWEVSRGASGPDTWHPESTWMPRGWTWRTGGGERTGRDAGDTRGVSGVGMGFRAVCGTPLPKTGTDIQSFNGMSLARIPTATADAASRDDR